MSRRQGIPIQVSSIMIVVEMDLLSRVPGAREGGRPVTVTLPPLASSLPSGSLSGLPSYVTPCKV